MPGELADRREHQRQEGPEPHGVAQAERLPAIAASQEQPPDVELHADGREAHRPGAEGPKGQHEQEEPGRGVVVELAPVPGEEGVEQAEVVAIVPGGVQVAAKIGECGGLGYENAQDPEAHVAPVTATPLHELQSMNFWSRFALLN